jgi:hypothetical protein
MSKVFCLDWYVGECVSIETEGFSALRKLGMMRRSCPHPQPLSQNWERGARPAGSGGVRANHTLNQQRDIFDSLSSKLYCANILCESQPTVPPQACTSVTVMLVQANHPI